MDNIDHNPSATPSTSAFHGTSVLLFQHPSQENQGKEREPPKVKGTAAKTVPELPDPSVNITLAHIANKIPTPS